MLQTLAQLVDKSLKIKRPIPLQHRFGEPGNYTECIEVFRPDTYLQYNRGFGSSNGIIAFIWENTMCVIPSTKAVTDILIREAFVSDNRIAVPCSNGEVPFYKEEKGTWVQLLAEKEAGIL